MPLTTISSMAIVNHAAVTNPHVSTSDVDPEAGKEVHGSQERIAFEVLLE